MRFPAAVHADVCAEPSRVITSTRSLCARALRRDQPVKPSSSMSAPAADRHPQPGAGTGTGAGAGAGFFICRTFAEAGSLPRFCHGGGSSSAWMASSSTRAQIPRIARWEQNVWRSVWHPIARTPARLVARMMPARTTSYIQSLPASRTSTRWLPRGFEGDWMASSGVSVGGVFSSAEHRHRRAAACRRRGMGSRRRRRARTRARSCA